MDHQEAFRKTLCSLRKSTGLNQLDFAARAGLSHSYYSDLESPSKATNPTFEVLVKLAGALGLGLTDLLSAVDSTVDPETLGKLFGRKPILFRQFTGTAVGDRNRIAAAVTDLMKERHFAEDDIEKTRIAFGEVYLNAVIHGNKNDAGKEVVVSAFLTPDEARIAVRDQGEGFDATALPSSVDRDGLIRQLDAQDQTAFLHGRGLHIARLYMDNVRFAGKGNLVEITKFNTQLAEIDNPMLRLQRMTISSWAELVEYRDRTTSEHLDRLPHLVERIAASLAGKPGFKSYLTPGYIRDLKTASILHDIGKVGISDTVLLKPGALTPEEFAQIKKHVSIGGNFLEKIRGEWRSAFPDLNSYFDIAVNVALYHHERWDGQGYVQGLKGNEIPVSARIVAVADVYDALTSDRPYRGGMPHADACAFIREKSGSMFDPAVVEGFQRVEQELATAGELAERD
ncbi:MAG: ATP-binding protein [Spirochaetes bacterium]|nr:ATP-binding protein [Spirochaetota bacterium]